MVAHLSSLVKLASLACDVGRWLSDTVSALHSMVAGSLSSDGCHGIRCWWDLIRSKQLSSVSHVGALPGFSSRRNSIYIYETNVSVYWPVFCRFSPSLYNWKNKNFVGETFSKVGTHMIHNLRNDCSGVKRWNDRVWRWSEQNTQQLMVVGEKPSSSPQLVTTDPTVRTFQGSWDLMPSFSFVSTFTK